MSLRTSATRYARALLDVAIQVSDPVRIGAELETLVAATRENRDLEYVFASPTVPAPARINVVKAVAEQSGMAPPLARLLVMLAERGRLELLPDLLEVYRERLLAHQNIVRATVTSAAPLADETMKTLAERLSRATGKQVQLTSAVDPALIGGVVTRIGGTVYDGSLRTQLQKMKQRLVENG